MKPIIQNYALKTLTIILLLISFNFIYKKTSFEKDLQKHAELINLVRDAVQKNSQVIYLGESSNNTYRENDRDKRSISELTSSYFPGLVFGHLTKEASHAGIYYEMLQNIPESSTIQTVIVTMNLRSFNAGWIYSNLETPLQKSVVLIKDNPPLFNRFLLSFKGYDIKTDKEREKQFRRSWKKDFLAVPDTFKYHNTLDWDNGLAMKGIQNPDGSINRPLTELACHYVKTYAFSIDTCRNPRIKDFDKIVQLAKKRKWNLIFNLMAENIEKADSLVGRTLVDVIDKNRKLLIQRYSSRDVKVVDNIRLVKNFDYIDQNWTTEHYAERGRKIIARNLADTLKLLYLNAFKVSNEKTSVFYNDCEGIDKWGQMQTLSSKLSYSGKKSSETNRQNNYSITFETAIEKLNEFSNKVQVQCQLYQLDTMHNAKLVLEIIGKNSTSSWQGKLLKDLSYIKKNWVSIQYNFELPLNFIAADVLKIYIFNDSGIKIYIDDFKIKFEE